MIPLNEVSNLAPELSCKTFLFRSGTGEIIKEYDNYPVNHEFNHIATKFQIIHIFDTKFLAISLKAKQLKHDYFRGITIQNIKEIYDYIIFCNVANFTFDSFLNSKINDIDFKSDFELQSDPFGSFCNNMKNQLKYPRLYSRYPNIGIEYSKRDTSTPSAPYVKYYSKGAELIQRSNGFASKYLKGFDNPVLRRVEVTVKNQEHKNYLERKLGFTFGKTLYECLSIDQYQIKSLILYLCNQHEAPVHMTNIKHDQILKDLSTTERLIFNLISKNLNSNDDISDILDTYFPKSTNESVNSYSVKKSRMKKLLIKLLEVKKGNLFAVQPAIWE
jgi:hypothetical protein